jgi:hypothetical protein
MRRRAAQASQAQARRRVRPGSIAVGGDLYGDADHMGHAAKGLEAARSGGEETVDVDTRPAAFGIRRTLVAVAVTERDDASSQRGIVPDGRLDSAPFGRNRDRVALNESALRRVVGV